MANTKQLHDHVSQTKNEDEGRHYVEEITRQQVKIAELEALLQYLHKELSNQQRLGQQAKSLYSTIDAEIMQALDKRGYTRKQHIKNTKFPAVDVSTKTKDKSMSVAREYDIQNYFQYRNLRDDMKLRYRLLSKTYRATRDTSKKGAKSVYRLTKRTRR